jgi:hypothetical protein
MDYREQRWLVTYLRVKKPTADLGHLFMNFHYGPVNVDWSEQQCVSKISVVRMAAKPVFMIRLPLAPSGGLG